MKRPEIVGGSNACKMRAMNKWKTYSPERVPREEEAVKRLQGGPFRAVRVGGLPNHHSRGRPMLPLSAASNPTAPDGNR